jgi:hypothetical protein
MYNFNKRLKINHIAIKQQLCCDGKGKHTYWKEN